MLPFPPRSLKWSLIFKFSGYNSVCISHVFLAFYLPLPSHFFTTFFNLLYLKSYYNTKKIFISSVYCYSSVLKLHSIWNDADTIIIYHTLLSVYRFTTSSWNLNPHTIKALCHVTISTKITIFFFFLDLIYQNQVPTVNWTILPCMYLSLLRLPYCNYRRLNSSKHDVT